jgi:hypothetical protein
MLKLVDTFYHMLTSARKKHGILAFYNIVSIPSQNSGAVNLVHHLSQKNDGKTMVNHNTHRSSKVTSENDEPYCLGCSRLSLSSMNY